MQGPSGYLWQPKVQPPGVLEPFRELDFVVSDVEASVRYYCDVLGMHVVRSERNEGISRVRACQQRPAHLHFEAMHSCAYALACKKERSILLSTAPGTLLTRCICFMLLRQDIVCFRVDSSDRELMQLPTLVCRHACAGATSRATRCSR
jgi:Glyoxalase/Bleomycin resistance protein/Dioxygenase superfamily